MGYDHPPVGQTIAFLAAIIFVLYWSGVHTERHAATTENHLREMRAGNGPTRLLVYCSDQTCSHSVVIDAAPWGDDVRLSDLEPKFKCKACGRRGADVRPLFERAFMGTG